MQQNKKLIEKTDDVKTLYDVLMLLKESIMRDLHVSTLAFYSGVVQNYDPNKKYSIIRVKPFTLLDDQKEYFLNVYCFSDIMFEANQIVHVVFTDNSFIESINKGTQTTGQNIKLHDSINGVIISPILSITDEDTYVKLTYNGQTFKLKKGDDEVEEGD